MQKICAIVFLALFCFWGCDDLKSDFSTTNRTGQAPLTVYFQEEARGDLITMWLWDFGDGQTSIEKNPKHIYRQPGQYTISLTVYNQQSSSTCLKEDHVVVEKIKINSTTTSYLPPTTTTTTITTTTTTTSVLTTTTTIEKTPSSTTTTIQKEANIENVLLLESLGNWQYLLKANIRSYSDIDPDQACILGWEDNWDDLKPMEQTDEGWCQIELTATSSGIKSLVITDSDLENWFWIDDLDHPLIIPAGWIKETASTNEKIIAFEVEKDCYNYIYQKQVPKELIISPSQINASLGQEISVTVKLDVFLNDVFGIGFNLNYNPEALKLVRVENDKFYPREESFFTYKDKGGKIVFGNNLIGYQQGYSGPNKIATFTFEAINQGDKGIVRLAPPDIPASNPK